MSTSKFEPINLTTKITKHSFRGRAKISKGNDNYFRTLCTRLQHGMRYTRPLKGDTMITSKLDLTSGWNHGHRPTSLEYTMARLEQITTSDAN